LIDICKKLRCIKFLCYLHWECKSLVQFVLYKYFKRKERYTNHKWLLHLIFRWVISSFCGLLGHRKNLAHDY
jgi:hypothetical protein